MRILRTSVKCHLMAMVFCHAIFAQQTDIKGLLQQLQSERPLDRIKAARALGETRAPESVAPLVKCLSDTNTGVQIAAGAALMKIGRPVVRPPIQDLSSTNKDSRIAATRMSGEIGNKPVVATATSPVTGINASVKAAQEALAKPNTSASPMAHSNTVSAAGESKPSPAASPLAADLAGRATLIVFKSQLGFSLQHPIQWVVATKEQAQDVGKAVKTVAPNLKSVDMNRLAVMIYNPASREFAENLNVVLTRGTIPINPEACKEYTTTLANGFRQAGTTVSNLTARLATVAGVNCLSAHWQTSLPQVRTLIRHWQVAVPGQRQTYILTCSAPERDWPRLEFVFERMINSLQIEQDKEFSWSRVKDYAKAGFVSALISMAIVLIILLFFQPSRG